MAHLPPDDAAGPFGSQRVARFQWDRERRPASDRLINHQERDVNRPASFIRDVLLQLRGQGDPVRGAVGAVRRKHDLPVLAVPETAAEFSYKDIVGLVEGRDGQLE